MSYSVGNHMSKSTDSITILRMILNTLFDTTEGEITNTRTF